MALEPGLRLSQDMAQQHQLDQRVIDTAQWTTGAALGFLAGVLGYMGWPTIALFCLMVLDFFSGVMVARTHSRLQSKIGMAGLVGKAHLLMIVLALAIIQQAYSFNLPAAEAVAGGFALMELLSLVENAKLSGAGGPLIDTLIAALRIRIDPPKGPGPLPPGAPA